MALKLRGLINIGYRVSCPTGHLYNVKSFRTLRPKVEYLRMYATQCGSFKISAMAECHTKSNCVNDMQSGDFALKAFIREMRSDFQNASLEEVLKDLPSKKTLDETVQQEEELTEEDEYLADYYDTVDDSYYGVDMNLEDIDLYSLQQKRGESGVFDIDDLVVQLQKENARDICVIHVPPSIQYANYIVVCSGLSVRHLRAISENLSTQYKQQRWKEDPDHVRIEGENSNEWKAIDFGNIVLHLMMEETRQKYDIEMLWAVGEKYDDKYNEKPEDIWEKLPDLEFLEGPDFGSEDRNWNRTPLNNGTKIQENK